MALGDLLFKQINFLRISRQGLDRSFVSSVELVDLGLAINYRQIAGALIAGFFYLRDQSNIFSAGAKVVNAAIIQTIVVVKSEIYALVMDKGVATDFRVINQCLVLPGLVKTVFTRHGRKRVVPF